MSKLTRKLDSTLNGKEFSFSLLFPRNNSLEITYKYSIEGSGLISFMLKAKEIWGREAVERIIGNLLYEVDNYEKTTDTMVWLNKNRENYPNRNKEEFCFLKEHGNETSSNNG